MAKKKKTTAARNVNVGSWGVKKKGSNEVVLTLPKKMEVTGGPLTIDDIAAAIAISKQKHKKKAGAELKCCSGNVAIA